mmetsp:Transcript_4026/g.15030  ORF Transcript_4026/g.15030 Transcript_4026/m.15030 type:complete len:227 (-) Transcript_4026:16-696(-)
MPPMTSAGVSTLCTVTGDGLCRFRLFAIQHTITQSTTSIRCNPQKIINAPHRQTCVLVSNARSEIATLTVDAGITAISVNDHPCGQKSSLESPLPSTPCMMETSRRRVGRKASKFSQTVSQSSSTEPSTGGPSSTASTHARLLSRFVAARSFVRPRRRKRGSPWPTVGLLARLQNPVLCFELARSSRALGGQDKSTAPHGKNTAHHRTMCRVGKKPNGRVPTLAVP